MAESDSTADEPGAYLFKIVVGPTYRTADFEVMLRLLSQRFTGELWSYGSYDANIMFGRMRLRVIKERAHVRSLNHLRFARAVMRRARELRSVPPGQRLVVTSYDPFKGGVLAWR